MISRLGSLFTVPCLFVLSRPILAEEQADLHVVIRFDSHRVLDSHARHDVCQQLEQILLAAVGRVCRPRVFDAGMQDALPYWGRAFDAGLERLDSVSRAERIKTHFVKVEFSNGTFRIRTRQLDAAVGWCSPVVRDEVSPDRSSLPRIIFSQVLLDYGLGGAVVASDGQRAATVQLPLGTSKDWVRPGDVFAVTAQSAGSYSAMTDTWLVAKAEPNGDQLECRVESRYQRALDGWETGRFRAVKVGTVVGPVGLRATLPGGGVPPDLAVTLSADGLEKGDRVREHGILIRGRYTSQELYDRLAFARISAGDRLLVQIPVPVTGGDLHPVEIRTDLVDARGGGSPDLRAGATRLNDLLLRLREDRIALSQLVARRQHRIALERVRDALRRLDEDETQLTGLVAGLSQSLGHDTVTDLVRMLAEVKAFRKYFSRLADNLARASVATDSPEVRRQKEAWTTRIAQAETDVENADYESAIGAFEAVLQEAGEWPELRGRLDDLRKGWTIRSEAHREARRFVYDVLAKAETLDDFERQLAPAGRQFTVCRDVGDSFTARKLYVELTRGLDLATRQDHALRNSDSEESTKRIETARSFRRRARALVTEVESFIRPAH